MESLDAIDAVLAYEPLAGEPDYRACPLLASLLTKHIIFVPQDRSADPFEFATNVIATLGDKKVALLIPGSRFDMSGTRYGRGEGWFDRFLSRLPRAWLRIGVLRASQLSPTPLTRQAWDEPVDYLLIENAGEWSVHRATSPDQPK